MIIMDYFVKKHINKKLVAKTIFEGLSFITILFWFLIQFDTPDPGILIILFLILTLISFPFSIILNLRYIKKQDLDSYILPLFTAIFLFFIAIGTIFLSPFKSVSDFFDVDNIISSIYIISILISNSISANIQLILLKPEKQNLIIQKSKEEEKIKQHAIGTSFTADSKIRLFGMIKLKKTLDLKETSEKLGLPQEEIENLLFDLAGENKISGDFKEGIFHITSNVDEFINQLDDIFSEWSDNEKTKHMKI